MNTCKTCKWWGPNTGDKPRPQAEIGACKWLTADSVRIYDGERDMAGADEGGPIICGPDFGCIHHDPK